MKIIICPYCLRQLPNKSFLIENNQKCIWCSVKHHLKQLKLKEKIKFRKITLKLDNGKTLSWNPLEIKDLIIAKDYIIINTKIYKKSECYYPHWVYFINELNRIFEL